MNNLVEVIETDCAAGGGLMNQSVRRTSESSGGGVASMPYIKIIEQPASKALRFRYECEGRSAGSIPGVNSTPENKTFPTIQIVGYRGRAVVVVSCVTKDSPYRPHPHNLVGKEGCKKGVCTVEINNETMTAAFANLGIQCVKKKDIEEALRVREEIRVDPFRTGFSHKTQTSGIDLNSVRLCFQAFLEGPQRGKFTNPLSPIVSEPIYDKKAMADLVICKLSHCSGSVAGGNEIILLCEKVAKEDISVRFYEEKDGQVVWEGLGDFTPTQVHKQVAISFRTPRYKTLEIEQPVQVLIQLRRPSDNATSEALPFQITPLDSGRPFFWSLRRSIGQKADYRTFSTILQTNTKLLTNQERIDDDANNNTNNSNNNNEIKDVEVEDNVVSVADIPQPKVVVVSNQEEEIKDEEENCGQSELEQLLVKDLENICNNNSDLGIYTSFQMALKNPCQDLLDHESYEDIAPPRPTAAKPTLLQQPLSPVPHLDDEVLPPLPPKRAKRTGPDTKTLPSPPQKKTGLFQKLFNTNKRKKNKEVQERPLQSRGSIKSLPAEMIISSNEVDVTEAEHYALYTSVAPHATASEFDEMSFYYSSVEQQKVN
ncbi:embryonic polarity protein dorsal-like isoform X3 [Rhodnius prolixus]|uniref:embryonic polarity protein dorsal-like isoform X3 n=1 Tax=Rhodnius prolixus TaxID=13249 RepID=UPI003D18D569